MATQRSTPITGYSARLLTFDDLHNFARHHASMHRGDFGSIAYWLAVEVLGNFLGDEWLNNNLNPLHLSVDRDYRKSRAFLDPDVPHGAPFNRQLHRIALLASHLYNLQSTVGFEYVIEEIRRMHLMSRFDELLCAGLVRKAGVPLRFLRPTKSQNEFFPDFEILWGTGHVISAEVEGKDEDTTPTLNTLRNSLKHAKGQLPADRPGIIFVRLSQAWAAREDVQDWMRQETDRIFRGSQRVVAAVWIWTEGYENEVSNNYIGFTRLRADVNRHSRLLTEDLSNFLFRLLDGGHSNWITIQAGGGLSNWITIHDVAGVVAVL